MHDRTHQVYLKQHSLSAAVELRFAGPRHIRVLPAEAGHGVTFVRRDLPAGQGLFVARWHELSGSAPCATLGNPHGHELGGVAPLLGIFYLLGLDNARVEVHGAELPRLDGAGVPGLSRSIAAGLQTLDEPRDILVVRRPVRLRRGERWAELLPAVSPRMTVHLGEAGAPRRTTTVSMSLAHAVPRCSMSSGRVTDPGLVRGSRDALTVRQAALAGADDGRSGPGGRTRGILDVIGELALGGAPLVMHYRAGNPCCHLNAALVRLLVTDRAAWYTLSADAL
jgi:UDP-3-O-[3-hydroxymyristoyl] N-acetylglucosamine deacetylase